MGRFEREVDPAGNLPEEERRRRAEQARKAYFVNLARLSANARRAKNKIAGNEPAVQSEKR